MNRVQVIAKLMAPIAIKHDRQSERSTSVRSVSGTLVRGALASVYLQRHGEVDDAFKHLFMNEDSCRFGPLDPGINQFPLTAVACKREGIKHALADLLWFRIAQHHTASVLSQSAQVPWRKCASCEADLKGHEGFWSGEDGGEIIRDGGARYHVAAHVGIDRHSRTAAESIFYTLEALVPSGEPQDLYGWIMADRAALTTLRTLLDAEERRISVGHHRTRGYGDVELRLDAVMPPVNASAASGGAAWTRWSHELVQCLGSAPFFVPDVDAHDFYFSLSFPTGAIIVDRFLRYTLDPSDMISWLARMPCVDDAFPLSARPVRQLPFGGSMIWVAAITRHERVRGWNAAHGLPRQDEWAVARGAVYVYRFTGSEEQRQQLIQELVSTSETGIGLRRNEGFGMMVVSDDFHRRFYRQQSGGTN